MGNSEEDKSDFFLVTILLYSNFTELGLRPAARPCTCRETKRSIENQKNFNRKFCDGEPASTTTQSWTNVWGKARRTTPSLKLTWYTRHGIIVVLPSDPAGSSGAAAAAVSAGKFRGGSTRARGRGTCGARCQVAAPAAPSSHGLRPEEHLHLQNVSAKSKSRSVIHRSAGRVQ